jgi:hypothetical protein
MVLVIKLLSYRTSGNLYFWSFFLHAKEKTKLFLVFLTIKILIAAIYGKKFITRTQDYKEKLMHIEGRNNQSHFTEPKKTPIL